MKHLSLFLSLVFCLSINSIFSQLDTIWYDSNWNEVDRKTAEFYRTKPSKKGSLFLQIDYYLSGMKQMEAYSKEENEPIYEGKVNWYFENGNVYQEVNYSNGVLHGNRKVYFENGDIKDEREYVDGKLHGKWKEYYENGQLKEKGAYEENLKEGLWETYYRNGKPKEKGKYIFDKKVDVWTTNYYDGVAEGE